MRFLQGTGVELTAEDLKPLNEDQNRAIIEALFVGIAADSAVNEAEKQAFLASVSSYPWNFPMNQLGPQVEATVMGLSGLSREQMSERLRQLGSRLPTPALREKTFAAMFAMMLADGKLEETEDKAAGAFAQLFGIEHARAVQIATTVATALKAAVAKQ